MLTRLIILIVIVSPLLIFAFIGSLHWYRDHSKTKRENKELREIANKTKDDRDWNTLFNDLEQRQYRKNEKRIK